MESERLAPPPTGLRVTFIEPDGSRRSVDIRSGMSLMEAALRNLIAGIDAKCRGNCACVTCHVHIARPWLARIGPRGPMEDSMLDFADGVTADSRLACQVRVGPDCDGMEVRVPSSQRTLGL
jgi:2Fe-2S ferredoxin